jgi:hypothetical protein
MNKTSLCAPYIRRWSMSSTARKHLRQTISKMEAFRRRVTFSPPSSHQLFHLSTKLTYYPVSIASATLSRFHLSPTWEVRTSPLRTLLTDKIWCNFKATMGANKTSIVPSLRQWVGEVCWTKLHYLDIRVLSQAWEKMPQGPLLWEQGTPRWSSWTHRTINLMI